MIAPIQGEVGQIITIKSVDENGVPTDYETAGPLTEAEIDAIMDI